MDYITPFITFMMECDALKESTFFMDAAEAKTGHTQICTNSADKTLDVEYADGSVDRQIVFTLFDYRAVDYLGLIQEKLERDGNIENLVDVQSVIDWVTLQNRQKHFPDFGDDYEVTRIESLYFSPQTPTIDKDGLAPAIAKYSIPIRIYFTDYTEAI